MRSVTIVAALMLLLAMPAAALDTSELLALIAMPLAVNAVADATGVSLGDITNLVSMLNRGSVAPTQVVQVLRYAPVALVVEETRPQFLEFVNTQVVDGVTGTRLVQAIDQRLRTYDITPQLALAPSSELTVVDQNFLPQVVRTRVAEHRRHPHGGPPGQLKKTVGVQTGAEIVHGDHPASRVTSRSSQNPEPPGQRKKEERSMSGGPQGGPPPQAPNDGKGQNRGKGKGKGKGKG